ncbi:MAG: hypothetical protein E7642_01760 [Ruminococcaceae bacterium]|nr:hypothetical protein [Oscillospiraceae bacterium]
MKDKNRKNDTKRLTVCAMLAALSVVLLYFGSVIEVLDLSMAVIASLACIIAVIEYGKSAPWAIYGVTSLLSLILLPNKTPAAFYAIFFGFYPILKEKFEKRGKVLCWVLKEAVFNVCLAGMGVAAYFLSTTGDNTLLSSPVFIGILVVAAELVFILYDIALTRLISFYIIRLRHRFKF